MPGIFHVFYLHQRLSSSQQACRVDLVTIIAPTSWPRSQDSRSGSLAPSLHAPRHLPCSLQVSTLSPGGCHNPISPTNTWGTGAIRTCLSPRLVPELALDPKPPAFQASRPSAACLLAGNALDGEASLGASLCWVLTPWRVWKWRCLLE